MKFSPIDHLALQLGLCSVAAIGFVVRPAPNANVHRRGSQMPRQGGGGAAPARVFRQHALTMTTDSENNDGLDLDAYSTPQELTDAVSDQTLQNALDTIGLKSNDGASPLDKAKLLFLTKYLPLEDIPEKYWAEPKGGKEDGGSVTNDTSVAPTIAPTVDTVNATSTSGASTESESDEKNPFNSTSSNDIGADDVTAGNGSTDEDNGSEDATSIETTTSAGAIGKADGSGNATGVDTPMSSEVDEPLAPLSETDDSTGDSESSESNDTTNLDLDLYDSYQELCEALDADVLRAELQRIGLKSDGTSMDLAKRLFITKYFPIDQIPEEYLEVSSKAIDEKVTKDGTPSQDTDTDSTSDDAVGFDLDLYDSYQELCEAYNDDVLRAELQRVGLKSDGTSMDMAKRLFITKYFPIDQIPEEYLEALSAAADAKGGGIGQEEAVLEASAGDTKLVTEDIDNTDECVDDNDDEKDDDDEVERLEEEQRLLEMELEAVEARIGETVEADPVVSTPDASTKNNETVKKDEQSLNEPETTKMSKATDLTEKESQTDVPAFPTASGNAQAAAAAVKEQTERQRLEVERIKAERIAAEEEAIRREKERIAAAKEELEDDEEEEYEDSAIDSDGAEDIVEEDEDVVLDQGLPEGVSEIFEMEQDREQPVEQEESEEKSNPFDSKAAGAGLPPSSTLPSSNPFIAGMPPSSTLPSSNPFVTGPSKKKPSEDDASSEDQESVSSMPSSPAFSSPNPFVDPPSQENMNKENNPVVSEQAEVNVPTKEEEEPKGSEFRFEADRIKAEQEAKRQELARERIEAEVEVASQSKDMDTKEKSSGPSILSRVASAAAGTIGLGVLAVGGSLFLDVSDSGNDIQSVPSMPSPPIAEVISSTDISINVPDASIGESSRVLSEKVEDSSKSSATDSPLVDESGGTPAGDSPPLTAPEAEKKLEAEALQPVTSNEDTTAATSISTSEEESKDDVPAAEPSSVSSSDTELKQELEILRSERTNEGATAAVPSSTSDSQSKENAAESSSLGSSDSETKPEPEAVTTDTVKGDGDTSPKATTLISASEEPPAASPPSSPPAPPSPPKQQQQHQEPVKPANIVVSKPETVSLEKSGSVAVQSRKSESTAPVVENMGKVSSDNSPSIELPALKAPPIDGILPSAGKIKRIASGIDFSNGAKIAGVASVAALGAIGVAMQRKDEAAPGKSGDGAGIAIEDTTPLLNKTNSTAFELPAPPQATNKTSAPMPFPAKNLTAQNVFLNTTGIAKELNESSTKSPFKPSVASSTGPVKGGGPRSMSSFANTGMKDRAEKNPLATPQAFVASSPGPKKVIKPIDAEIISSEKDTDSDESLQKVLDEASEAVADAEAALKNTTETGSNSTSSAKVDTNESEEDKRIAAEFKAAKEKMEAEKMERIEKAKSAEAQFLDQERKKQPKRRSKREQKLKRELQMPGIPSDLNRHEIRRRQLLILTKSQRRAHRVV